MMTIVIVMSIISCNDSSKNQVNETPAIEESYHSVTVSDSPKPESIQEVGYKTTPQKESSDPNELITGQYISEYDNGIFKGDCKYSISSNGKATETIAFREVADENANQVKITLQQKWTIQDGYFLTELIDVNSTDQNLAELMTMDGNRNKKNKILKLTTTELVLLEENSNKPITYQRQ